MFDSKKLKGKLPKKLNREKKNKERKKEEKKLKSINYFYFKHIYLFFSSL